ncbi:hypothetical protein H0H81_004335 [Sphagnurus paluster]|uniref:Protein kinase domain-containing protein n=1 Tax=Sphagnurus paluster TaxID=117069 RepID=A0A9P7FSI7_9AGAR|nr:hypothetical protein H0H81_004335 [Sphagnurus paluster]
MGNEGHEHLKILRKLATGETSLLSNNHTLPMFSEFHFEDITFGIFPKVGGAMRDAWYYWAKNSVGDVVDMIMQMLEALAFIHSMNVAHRDAFHDNFLVQWQPESLRQEKISISRPRVYLIDFEVAIQFPPECPPHERASIGFPLGGSFPDLAYYGRPHAPECVSGNPYDPFKLDVWQLGKSFWNFKTTVPAIDELLLSMIHGDPTHRPDAADPLDKLATIVNSMTPESLFIRPDVPPLH